MKIYVVAHKRIKIKLQEDYELFQVNAVNRPIFCENNDATGDNISSKNPNYCELTAVYWIWKNDNESDIVGLAHYRRFLTKKIFSNSPVTAIKRRAVEKYLRKYDILLPRPIKFDMPVREQIKESVYENDLVCLNDIIANDYPEYLDDYESVLNGKQTYYCNIMICKKPLWNKYCEWLFAVLNKLETRIDMTGYDDTHRRLYGYLSERLLTVFVNRHKLKVKTLRMSFSEISFFGRLKNRLRKLFYKVRSF